MSTSNSGGTMRICEPNCYCGLRAQCLTSWTNQNPNCRFVICRNKVILVVQFFFKIEILKLNLNILNYLPIYKFILDFYFLRRGREIIAHFGMV